MSLSIKMFIVTAVILAFVLGMITVSFYLFDAVKVKSERERYADVISRAVQDMFSSLDQSNMLSTEEEKDSLRTVLMRSTLVDNWIVLDSQGQAVVLNHPTPSTAIASSQEFLAKVFSDGSCFVYDGHLVSPAVTPSGYSCAVITDLGSMPMPELSVSKFLTSVTLVMVLGTLLIFLNIFVYFRNIVVVPVHGLIEASKNVGKGDYGAIVEGELRSDEFGKLIQTFNAMTSALKEYRTDMEGKVASAVDKMREAEKGLVVAQRLSAMGTLASGIAHEINNPLGGMMNAAAALKNKELPPEKKAQYIDIIIDGLSRVDDVVKKVLSFTPSRRETVKVGLSDVVSKAAALARFKADEKGVQLRNFVPADLPAVEGDPGELQQVFLNILMNSLDATIAPGNDVTMTGKIADNKLIEITVADRGEGIAEQDLSKVLDPFYTTKDPGKGTGLGLSIAHNIVLAHGGAMSLSSKTGHGTTVRISLPAALK